MHNLIVGLGEVGKPLAALLAMRHSVTGVDIRSRMSGTVAVDVMHVCFPYRAGFAKIVTGYIAKYQPSVCIIHSTVVPGSTGTVQANAAASVVYSPVRGRHDTMKEDLKRYTKFVAGSDDDGVGLAVDLFESVGIKAMRFSSAEALELAKLFETTYSGVLIAWAQEMSRFCEMASVDYLDVVQFFAEVGYLPRFVFQPGHIGGHCIMQNLALLAKVRCSPFIDAVRESNDNIRRGDGERLYPIPLERQ